MPDLTHAREPIGDVLRDVDPDHELPPCGLRQLVLGGDALSTVADTVSQLLSENRGGHLDARPRVALLVDRVAIGRKGEDVKAMVERQLEGRFSVERTVLDDGHPVLHVVDDVLDAAAAAVSGVDAVVAVGGGTISDIAKLAARATDDGLPPVLVSVQTAASVDGYTDDVSVVLRGGVKRTVPSRWPDAVVADAETIAEAPAAMNRAGYGEMTSMLVAPADWRLASLVGTDDTFHRGPIRLLELVGQDVESWSAGVKDGDPQAVAALTRALALRGIATGVAGTTAVLSGVEHLISHMLDQYHGEHHLPMGLHGAQVGVASVVSAAAWEMLFERLRAGRRVPLWEGAFDPEGARARVEAAFSKVEPSGRVAGECWRDYSTKLATVTRNRARVEQLLARWSDHEDELRRLVRPSSELAAGLRAAGSSATFEELDPRVGQDLARWAVINCGLMRNRFTVVDLLTLLGWWTEPDVAEVFDRCAKAVAAAEGGV